MSDPTNGNKGNTLPASLTEGQKAVGVKFNPSNNPDVDNVKQACADVIDLIEEQITKAKSENNGEKIAQLITAKRRLQEGQMWAVKAITWEY